MSLYVLHISTNFEIRNS